MQDTFLVENELLLFQHEDVGIIHHVGDEDQHIDISSNFGGMHGFGSGAEGMEVGGDVCNIHCSGGDAQGTKVADSLVELNTLQATSISSHVTWLQM